MTWVVDTCVIIDVLRGDETFSIKSSMALQAKLDVMGNDVSFDVFNQSCAKKYVNFNDVVDFLNGKLETEYEITTW